MEENNYYNEYEIDLMEYLYLIYKNKLMILGITFLFVIISAFASFFILEESYKSELTFMASNFKLITGENINKDEYINFFQRDQIKENILNKFYPEEDNNIFLDDRFKITTEEESKFIKLSYTGSESKKTALVLNELFKSFENEVYGYLEINNNNYLNSLENKKENDYQQYVSNLEEYNQFKTKNNISLLKTRLNRKENRLVKMEENIIDINNELRNKNMELETVNQQYQKIDKFLVKKESISDESLNKLQSINPDKTLINLLTTENQFLNPQYSNLINRKNNINQQISVLKSELKNNKNEVNELKTEIINLEEKIINLEEKEEILNNELNNTRSNYQTAINQYDRGLQSLAGKDYKIDLISKANINEHPVSPNIKLNIAIAGILGLMLAIFIVFLKEFIKNADLSQYE
jgi:capsular polysaccharide biosynthesis protein